ncbi:branched-chain amino acid ABC transporter permease [Pseudonocardia acidicola]|uniref:Branched-chain amino acid ABC transporter permease n=1 Tax=Pseudonocardia acidicola TaxID=2724939 RepID=A0ABX1S5F8_9PSEU|nr:branched-chain amino acid ABC transporter permease [Pseudonocardia acidicola]NMH96149.1 branched-chain amino acid ABC transporter permease [Pseudonocardia acidicola]
MTDTASRPGNPLTRARRAAGGLSDGVRDWWAAAPRWQRWTGYGLALALAIVAPAPAIGAFMSPYTDWTSLLFNPIGTYVLLAIGLNIVVGYAGLLDLGYVAFYAIGAYTLAYLGTKHGFPFWPTLVMGVFLAAVSGIILGAPTLRLRGDYLAIVTLGFGEIVRITAVNTDEIGGARGITPIPHPPGLFGVEFLLDPLPYYYLILFFIVLAIVFSLRLQRSRVGRAWTAIREDEDAAELMGVPTFRFKLLAFAMGASVGGLAGVVFASKVIFIAPTNFPFILSATILAAVLLGGAGNLPGVILGAFLIAWLPERFRGFADYRIMVFGAALVLTMALRPQGILPSRQRRAELKEGAGGGLGGEVPGPETEPETAAVEAAR